MQRHRALTSLLISSLFLAACGGDGADEAGTTTTAPPETTETTAPSTDEESPDGESSDPAKAARAEAATLRMQDLPAGWGEQDPEAGLGLEATWQDLISCLGVELADQPLGIATSPTFLRDLATQVRSTVEYLPEAQAQVIAAALDSPEFQQCATDAFAADAARSAPEGGSPGPVEVSPLEFPELGEETFAWRANVTIDLGGMEVPVFQDLVVVLDGEALTRLMFLNPGSEFPPELQRTLVETVVARAG